MAVCARLQHAFADTGAAQECVLPRAVPRMSRSASPAASGSRASLPSAPAGLFAGTSGWAYSTWKPGFYPATLPARRFLPFYASHLNSVEVNATFRKLPTPEQIAGWVGAVPEGFRFSFKAPQRITHFQRLRESAESVREFFDLLAPVRRSGHLGIVLFQLPPNFKADHARLKQFLRSPALRRKSAPPIAFEFRHDSWFTDETFALLRLHDAALCVAESESLVTPDVQTAAHRCYRLRVAGGYSPRALKAFAKRFATLAAAGDTYVYFKHEEEPTGALNAAAMLRHASKRMAANGAHEDARP